MLSKFFFDSLILSYNYIYTSPFYIFIAIFVILSTTLLNFLIPRVIKDIEKRYNVDITLTKSRMAEVDFCKFISQSYLKKYLEKSSEFFDKYEEDNKNFQFKYDIKSENKFNIIVCLSFYFGTLALGIILILPYIVALIINLLKLLLY